MASLSLIGSGGFRPFAHATVASLCKFALSLSRVFHSFFIQLGYFLCISVVGFLLLKRMPSKRIETTAVLHKPPSDLDLFFMSVSAATVSSMSTVEMEYFSNAQLMVLIILMLVGAEPFTSMLGLLLKNMEVEEKEDQENMKQAGESGPEAMNPSEHQIELGLLRSKLNDRPELRSALPTLMAATTTIQAVAKPRAVRNCLVRVMLGYIVVFNVLGSILLLLYLVAVPSAKDVLRVKNIPLLTFSVFTVVSSFGNCGFVPTNENMIVFRKHPGLLLLVATVVLAGNTLYAPLLRSAIWALGKWSRGKPEAALFQHLLEKRVEVGTDHLLSARRCVFLSLTVAGLLLVQLMLFCIMEWDSDGLEGMNAYQKAVAGIFMSVNSRHAGESISDISTFSSAVLVLYVVMMYLPPYTTFMPVLEHDQKATAAAGGGDAVTFVLIDSTSTHGHGDQMGGKRTNRARELLIITESLAFSNLSYLVFFTVLVCVVEMEQLTRDPLNFNVLNIVIEVVSAYGNVGFSTGYSCARRLWKDDGAGDCRDMWYGFSGRWSSKGKMVLICVMLFGRLKRLTADGSKAWILG